MMSFDGWYLDKSSLGTFTLTLTVLEILTCQMFDLENSSHGYGVHHSNLCHSINDILLDVNSNVCPICCHLPYWRIRKNSNHITLKMKVNVKKRKNWTENVCFYIFQNFSSRKHTFTQQWTHCYTLGHSEWHGPLLKAKSTDFQIFLKCGSTEQFCRLRLRKCLIGGEQVE